MRRLTPLLLIVLLAAPLPASQPFVPPVPVAMAAAAATATFSTPRFPWRDAGLTERQAAAHLLDRFTFGPRPGDVDRVVAMGLETWFRRQLDGGFPERRLQAKLEPLAAVHLTAEEIRATYPGLGQLLAEAQLAGSLPDDVDRAEMEAAERAELRRDLVEFARQRGYRSERQLLAELLAQKLYRTVYAENQVREVLTEFWLNHFHVSLADRQARAHILAYERDAIRPRVTGKFRDLLEASAKHPAMLLYLDNAQSVAGADAAKTFEPPAGRGPRRQRARPNRPQGLNENYARELLELHTLGVDGGYSQRDVVEVARALSGWTVVPARGRRPGMEGRLERALGSGRGFVREGDFLFRADAHDAAPKQVLGRRLPGGRGIEDGEEVLDIVAAHPATARHLALKLAVRFVAEEPPAALVDRLAAVFRAHKGDLPALVEALVEAPEFWAAAARRQKIKSPLELTASALRALGAEIHEARATLEWLLRLGQLPYSYQAPTGFPDRAAHWVNTGSLLNRMNFALQLAAGRVEGVRFDLAALNGGREPESPEAALAVYGALLMPERDLTETVRQLEAVARDPELARKVVDAAPDDATEPEGMRPMSRNGAEDAGEEDLLVRRRGRRPEDRTPPTALEQVVGVLLGSPEFQRR